MKIVFLASSGRGLKWFRRYYVEVFPEDAKRARLQFAAMKRILAQNPHAGQPIHGMQSRQYHLPRTPFTVIYRLRDDRIEVLAVHDGRSDPATFR